MGLKEVYAFLESVIAVLATLGNILVIWVVKKNSASLTTTCYFILSLALADIAVGLVLPVAIMVDLKVQLPFEACLFMCCLLVACTQTSIMSLLAIAVDRYLRVRFLTRYRIITSQKRILVALGIVWLLSVMMGFAPIFGWTEKKSSYKNCTFTGIMKMEYMVYFSFFVGTLIPLIIMIVLYGSVFCIIQTKLRQWSKDVRGTRTFYRREFKIVKYLTLVLLLFAVSWLPLCIMNCIQNFCPRIKIPQYMWYIGILLSHSNSVMNPIVYAFKIKKFRETCSQILRTYIFCRDQDYAVNSTS
ncbi:adenosine receptor A3-like [Sphaerodactylus townsendi]|uniref:adenosine receptor A3-like n=1 Tax=Sphaerodactylus townsendi TaxID=933632 RepID=UPI002025BE92|nr:adenosine receptor A3-like [Sphaerodactylus townsendi]